jgi:hypothetical protein
VRLPAAVAATNDLHVLPASGGTKNTFTFQFTAPLGVPPGEYDVDVAGPVGCSYAGAYWNNDVTAGQPLSLPLDASYISGSDNARQWCIGRYSGLVYWHRKGQPSATVGRVGFVVHGPARYSGMTGQAYGVSFTVSRHARRIMNLTWKLRFWCSAGGYSAGRTLPLREGRRLLIEFHRGAFVYDQTVPIQGGRTRLQIRGHLFGGRFKGVTRIRGRGRFNGVNVACDSGVVKWTAR